jgi:hypothetical protein
MSDETKPDAAKAVRVNVTITAEQAALIDAFQGVEQLESRARTIALLLEIALETVSGKGRRFWDWKASPADSPATDGPADVKTSA